MSKNMFSAIPLEDLAALRKSLSQLLSYIFRASLTIPAFLATLIKNGSIILTVEQLDKIQGIRACYIILIRRGESVFMWNYEAKSFSPRSSSKSKSENVVRHCIS